MVGILVGIGLFLNFSLDWDDGSRWASFGSLLCVVRTYRYSSIYVIKRVSVERR